MNNIRLHSIVQKSIKKSSKKGYVDVKFRTRFINPLTEKRREILSEWYTVPNKADENGKIKISPQIKSLVYKELQIKANETFEEITKKSLKDKENITLNEVWTLWHQERLNQKLVQPKTLAGEEGRYRNHIQKYIPQETLIKNIPTNLIKNFIDSLYPIGSHKRIAQSVKSDLSSIFKYAIANNFISPDQNPMPYITIGKKGLEEEIKILKEKNIEDYYLESSELREVLEIVKKYNVQYARIFEFQALTGMRISEVLGLKIETIDFDKKIASVIRSRATHSGASESNYEGNVKNLQSYRKVQLSDRAIEILREEIEENIKHIQFNPDYKDNGWIFTSKSKNKPDFNGSPLHYSVLNNFLNSSQNGKKNKKGNQRRVGINIDEKISFNKHISTHIFRHTHISFLAEQGVPLEAIQDRVGHNRGSRVTNIYLHVTQKTKDTITPLIDSLTQQ
ncbi:site-specific integrase [Streptococcus macedonicus]|uniref:tyrosine-type recombinase/integrase n=1 Tax=Streptococcus TaxID=1301 RepID=UPI001BD99322|nr:MULTISPECIES: site-specific integrase [Streptococcus]MBT0897419.1 site-specific integrase [Streptococcus infantarius subsp. infantarius]MBT1048442.1 site-specific integrase [Streptococcus macedonicus]